MSDPTTLLNRLRDELVDGIPRFERRRRRGRALLTATSVVSLVAVVAALLVLPAPPDDRVVTRQPTLPIPPSTTPGTEVEITELTEGGVPVMLFASNVNAAAVAVSDLDRGRLAVYPGAAHTVADGGAIDSAVLTPGGDLVTWQPGRPTLVYPAEGDGQDALVGGRLEQPGREVGSVRGQRQVVPTDSGDGLWILESNPDADSLALELVDVATGEVASSTTAPPQSRLVDTVGGDAIVVPAAGAPTAEVTAVAPDGQATTIEAPGTATFVTATPSWELWITDDGELTITRDGDTTVVPKPGDGDWAATGQPTIPSSSPRLRTVTADGSRALLGLTDPDDPDEGINRLVVVDIEAATADVVYEGGGSTALWSEDDRTVAVVGSTGDRQTVTTTDTETGATASFEDVLPPGFFVVAAR